MKKIRLFLPFLIFIFMFVILSGMKSKATVWIVDVQNFSFAPAELMNVHVNDTIRWVWVSGFHTTTSSEIPAGAEPWDAQITSSDNEFEYVPTVAGTYDYVCTPHASLGMGGTFTVVSGVGIAESISSTAISISPNPFTDRVTINFESNNSQSVKEIMVFDLAGELAYKKAFTDNPGLSFTLHLNGLETGLYFFKFIDNSGREFIERVIKH